MTNIMKLSYLYDSNSDNIKTVVIHKQCRFKQYVPYNMCQVYKLHRNK